MEATTDTTTNIAAPSQRPESCFPALLSLCLSTAIFVWLMYYCRFGFDLTDEGFYLNWISRPFEYEVSNTQFGFLYHPLYRLLGGDVALLRQVNMAATYFLSAFSVWLLLKPVLGAGGGGALLRIAVATSIAMATMTYTVFNGLWLFPTPSYNWAAFQGLLVTLIGMLMAERSFERQSTIGWVLIGVGGWLAFMGKPTSAALLAPVVVLQLALSGKLGFRHILVSVTTATGLLLVTALWIDGGVVAFVERNVRGLEIGTVLVGTQATGIQHLFRLEPLVVSDSTLMTMSLLAFLTLASAWAANLQSKSYWIGGLAAGLLVAMGGYFVLRGVIPVPAIPASQGGLLFVAVAIGMLLSSQLATKGERFGELRWRVIAALVVLAALSYVYTFGPQNSYWVRMQSVMVLDWSMQSVVMFVLFAVLAMASPYFLLPYVYAFGTGNPYWVQMPSVMVFALFAALALVAPSFSRISSCRGLLGAGFVVQIVSIVLIASAFNAPYRNPPPLTHNDTDVLFPYGARLRLAREHARYLEGLSSLAGQSGFERGTPVIDMTGHSPGVLYYLGARSPGVAWTLGGYPGTAAFVTGALRHVPCEQLARSWLLSQPMGPIPIPESILESFGAGGADDFEIVGSVQGPHGVAQYLAKPQRNEAEALAACRLARGEVK